MPTKRDSEVEAPSGCVLMGEIAGVFGVRGWVKVHSFTQPVENILQYLPWQLHLNGQWRTVEIAESKVQGQGVVVRLAQCDDRDIAMRYVKAPIAVQRHQLPAAPTGEYYWADLLGMQVVTVQGMALGTVHHLFETGANDVVVVRGERERWIPYLRDYVVKEVDVAQRRIVVDWDPEF